MSDFTIRVNWMPPTTGDPEVSVTAARIDIRVDDVSLTRHQDVWTKAIRDDVFVSAYPLAMWFASSWWRLNDEPLPMRQPSHDWRMAHELGAANHGFVWPRVILSTDGESMCIWAAASSDTGQSVQYLQGLDTPRRVPLDTFQRSTAEFVQSVLDRLDTQQVSGSNLAQLWQLVQEDLSDLRAFRCRRLEAALGFDPQECPQELLATALQWQAQIGEVAFSELAPAIAAASRTPDLSQIEQLVGAAGVVGAPDIEPGVVESLREGAPWERAIHDARALRQKIGNVRAPLSDRTLYELLGVRGQDVSKWAASTERAPAAVAVPMNDRRLRFIPRRRSSAGRRFELARFMGEYLFLASQDQGWLVSTDLSTFHQKYQRAFAAEFLCPIDSLMSFLSGDFTSYAIEEAAAEFSVSELTVTNLLLSHGCISQACGDSLPYRVV